MFVENATKEKGWARQRKQKDNTWQGVNKRAAIPTASSGRFVRAPIIPHLGIISRVLPKNSYTRVSNPSGCRDILQNKGRSHHG